MISKRTKELLEELTDGNEEQMNKILNEPRSSWNGLTPLQMVEKLKEGSVIGYLERLLMELP